MKTLKELFYSKDHEWIKIKGNKAYVGISDYAQHALGDIVFVELPEVDAEITSGDVFGVIESVKAASDMYIPFSGKILEVNDDVVDNPVLVNEDCYENWMFLIEITNKEELKELMNEEQYNEYCSKEK
ncbi:glycine cleavage system protein GcvH [Clostridium sp. CM028]|uniref:glycine cleavage system protein GcvH n=1 Tax=unclassified Clostridium TaxID=2614128 RepID=UPI001C0BA7D2|nr:MULTISPECIES: glycine cleavage system protein GcvH [unclassified Clostridium]MBU3090904.1 glycine cleavage system protein GcvH [Clostridium sp. CF011]MBW9144528.1 glycine cleavage system protein GcvH [Clostridium sp. CM027]MBW9147942.1 glycine cleavage system protein GcvH [Clostridium sp. CM028]UVE40704.1 glycine cleavage system protein GcvH [Clostridium sp. CM027]WAG69672.1 glycine cleavage system protein GcvH [Clostridium sp. CF011]